MLWLPEGWTVSISEETVKEHGPKGPKAAQSITIITERWDPMDKSTIIFDYTSWVNEADTELEVLCLLNSFNRAGRVCENVLKNSELY